MLRPRLNAVGCIVMRDGRRCAPRVESSEKAVLCIDEDSGSVVEGDTNPDATKFFEQDGVPSAALKAMLDFLTRAEQNRTATDLALAALAEAGVI